MNMMLFVAMGGALGAASRYGLSAWLNSGADGRYMPGTLVVNVLGCFVMGCFFAWLSAKHVSNDGLRLFFGVGFLGAFTTFSTFSLETLQYLQRGDIQIAALNMLLSLFLSVAAVIMGFYLVRSVIH